MVRNLVGVLLSVFVISVFAAVAMAVAGQVMPETMKADGAGIASNAWLAASMIVSLIAACIGGIIVAAITKQPKAAIALAALVVVMSLGERYLPPMVSQAHASTTMIAEKTGVIDTVDQPAKPGWFMLADSCIAGLGVMLGARVSGAKSLPKPKKKDA